MTTFVWILGILFLFAIVKIAFNPKPARLSRPTQTGGHNHPAQTYWEKRGGK